jgi:asparagine synthase (glutamine-hydrolysing)
MCGVAFIFNENSKDEEEVSTALRNLLNKRGLDEFVSLKYGNAQHLFARLAIREIHNGSQPYLIKNGRFLSSINGELYNQSEVEDDLFALGFNRTDLPKGDMQLLGFAIANIGSSILKKIKGMFAGYVFDKVTGDIVCFRDKTGEKPIFVKHDLRNIIISSTPFYNSIDGEDLNHLRRALIQGYFDSPTHLNSWIEIPPGHFASISTVNPEFINVQKYWSWPTINSGIKSSIDSKDIKTKIRKAVERQLISDSPVCTLLSGGLDSALITQLSQEITGVKAQAFTLDFADSLYSERSAAERISATIGCELEVISLDPRALSQLIDSCIDAMPFPIFDTACLSLFAITKSINKRYKVALTGDGGDELFGGYSLQKYENYLKIMQRLPSNVRKILIKIFNAIHSNDTDYLNFAMLLRRASTVLENSEVDFPISALSPLSGTALFKNLSDMHVKNKPYHLPVLQYYREKILPLVYLTKSDRMGMANQIELRAPLLDSDLILDLTPKLNGARYQKRKIIGAICSEFLPPEVLNLRKHGFSSPICAILQHYQRPKWLLSELGISNNQANEVWSRALKGDANAGIAAWSLLVTNSFLGRYA